MQINSLEVDLKLLEIEPKDNLCAESGLMCWKTGSKPEQSLRRLELSCVKRLD